MAEASDSMEYQTCVLKVPIHCEGCKKKVKKVLFKIPGVHDAQIDSKQNKVTVVGTVDAGTIVNKLLKANKHAELWPDDKPANPNPEPSTEIKKTKPAVAKSDQKPKTETTPAPAPAPEDSAAKPADAPMEPSAKPVAEAETEKPKESAKSEPNSEKVSDAQPPEAAAKPSSSKKKGKKPQKTPVSGAGEVGEVSAPPEKIAENSARAVPRPVHERTVQQPQPVHAYNMAHPTTSHSYYAPAPPAPMQHEPQPYGFSYYQPPQAYAYPSSSHPEPAESHFSAPDAYYSPYSAYPPPESSYRYDEPPQPSSESYDMFSDENANACKVM